MKSPESNINNYQLKKTYPQVENLFQILNISEADRKKIQSEFYRIAKMIYENPQKLSNDTIWKIKLWETNRNSFVIMDDYESVIVSEYFDFIHSHLHWEEIWRILSTYYDPKQHYTSF